MSFLTICVCLCGTVCWWQHVPAAEGSDSSVLIDLFRSGTVTTLFDTSKVAPVSFRIAGPLLDGAAQLITLGTHT